MKKIEIKQKEEYVEESTSEVFTIPNILSFGRIILIPLFVYFYLTDKLGIAILMLILSAISDIADGFIARHFHMTSNLGIALDPIADKLTQAAVMLCIATSFPRMWIPLALITVKEIVTGIFGLITLRRTGLVKSARWYGKVTTILLYLMMGLHILWPFLNKVFPSVFPDPEFPAVASWITIGLCCVMMLFSFFMYVRRYILLIRSGRPEEGVTPNVK